LEVINGHPAYDGTAFRYDYFTKWLQDLRDRGLIRGWPVTATGKPSFSEKTLRRFSSVPEIEVFRQIRSVVTILEEPRFEIRQGRHYYSLLPFTTKTSRNTTKHCLIQAPSCLRGLIRPTPGTCLIHADFCQEEYYVAAVLSNDKEMQRLYASSDPYLAFAVMAGLVPSNATKKTHRREREMAKTVSLAMLYGQQFLSMSRKLGISPNRAQDLLRTNKKLFPEVWKWSDEQVRIGYGRKRIVTRYGWYMAVDANTKKQTLKNYPVQGLAADVLRLAHILLFEAGVRVTLPIHDAFLCECPESEAEETAATVRRIMERAGEHVLGAGTILRADVEIVRYPDRWLDRDRGGEMWDRIMGIVDRLSCHGRVAVPAELEASPTPPHADTH